MEPNSNTPTTKPADQLTATESATQSKSNKPLLATTIATSILALAGIGAGIYFFMDSNNKSTEISNLNAKIASLNPQINSNQSTTTPDSTNTESTDTATTVVNAKNYGFISDNFVGDSIIKYSDELGKEYTTVASISTKTEFGAKFSLQADSVVKMQITGDACKYYNNACVDGFFEKDITSLIPSRVVDISSRAYGNGGTSWVFFVLEDGTASYLWEYDALDGKQASTIENSQNMIHIFGEYLQDNDGKIHRISSYTNEDEEHRFKTNN